jgi:hypothetical protein
MLRTRLLAALLVIIIAGSMSVGVPQLAGQAREDSNEEPDNRSSRFFSREAGPIRSTDEAREAPARSRPTRQAPRERERSPFYSTTKKDVRSLLEENRELRLRLQRMELDRLRAVYNALPVEEAFALRDAIWLSPEIEVSWENPEAAPAQEREWVRDAVRNTWERHSALKFTGWNKVTGPNQRGIRIRIQDTGPHCKRLGNRLDGMRDGMVLNFTFNNWCPSCGGLPNRREFSIRAIAVHEFGHAIGFAHEQNRADAPAWCQEERQGSDGDWYVTIYDPESIMNYCSTEWNNQGELTQYDIEAVQTIYGPPAGPMPDVAQEEGLIEERDRPNAYE